MRYNIKDGNGVVINTVLASAEFMVANYAEGTYELVPEAAAPAPTQPRRKLSKLEFINLFTDEEYEDILAAAKMSVQVEAWVEKFRMTSVDPDGGSIDLADPRTISGIQALEAGTIIGVGRAAEILGL